MFKRGDHKKTPNWGLVSKSAHIGESLNDFVI